MNRVREEQTEQFETKYVQTSQSAWSCWKQWARDGRNQHVHEEDEQRKGIKMKKDQEVKSFVAKLHSWNFSLWA